MSIESEISDIEKWRLVLAVGQLMVSIFCAQILLLPGPNRRTRMPLGLFFLSNALGLLALPVVNMASLSETSMLAISLDLAEIPLSTAQPFLLWLYVRYLTADPIKAPAEVRFKWHALPIGFSVFVYCFVLLHYLVGVHRTSDLYSAEMSEQVSIVLMWGATIVFYALVPIYAVLTIKLLRRYRTRLKDLYASTEGRELTWIWSLTVVISFFWVFNFFGILVEAIGASAWMTALSDTFYVSAAAQIALFWTIALWGVRQQPGMTPPVGTLAVQAEPGSGLKKYRNSGLDDDRLSRIAKKIETVMQADRLYQNPDLSLWDLAEKVGANKHYVSQALNEKLEHSFFDYVNGWRLEDAKAQLSSSRASILTITYDVGFNSRSVFYRAFKQDVGLTPSQYRKNAAEHETGSVGLLT